MRPCLDGAGAKLRLISRSYAGHRGGSKNAYAAEMLAVQSGLGYLIWDARNGLRMDLLVSGMIAVPKGRLRSRT